MLFQYTRNHEETARALVARYDRVFVRNKNVLWTPIRMRRGALADLNPYVVLTAREFDRQLHAWNRDGGVIVYDRNYVSWEDVGAHQAQLLSEAPLSLDLLERYTESARELAVIFWPPSWDAHRKWVAANYPAGDACGKLYDIVSAAPGDEAMARLLKLEPGFRVLRDYEGRKAMGVRAPIFRAARRAVFRKRSLKPVWSATLRAPPEDRTLAEIYDFIGIHCPQADGVHLVLGATLMKKVRFWKRAMRALERCGSIAPRGLAMCYWPDELPPNFTRLDARRARADRQLDEMIAFVEALPEFTPETTRLRSPARPAKLLSASA